MRGLTILLVVLAAVLAIIYAAGNPISKQYYSQSVYLGNTIFVEDEFEATVNGEDAIVVHAGFTEIEGFQIDSIIELEQNITVLNGNETVNSTITQSYVILSHEVGGAFGKATPLLASEDVELTDVGEDFEAFGKNITYVSDFVQDGIRRHIYEVDGLYIVVGVDKYAFIELDETDGSGMMLQQDQDQVSASMVSKPFSISNTDLAKILGIMLAAIIIGIVLMKAKEDDVFGREA